MTTYQFMPSTKDKFVLAFSQLPNSENLYDNRKLILQLFDTVIPGLSFDLSREEWQGYKDENIYSNLEFSPLTISYVVDENFENWKLLFNWMKNINNNKDVSGKVKEDFVTDASLLVYDNFNENILKLSYANIFPYQMGEVGLSYREGESYLESTATFSYTYFEIKT